MDRIRQNVVLVLAVVGAAVAVMLGPAAWRTWTCRGRSTLPEIVDLVIRAIERGDTAALGALCVDRSSITADAVRTMQRVQKTHNYRVQFARWTAPWVLDRYTLGGHAYEHLHVEFVRCNGLWRFTRVWRCR